MADEIFVEIVLLNNNRYRKRIDTTFIKGGLWSITQETGAQNTKFKNASLALDFHLIIYMYVHK